MKRTAVAASILLSPLVLLGAIKTEPIPDLRPPRPELPPEAEQKSALPWLLGGAGIVAVAVALAWPRRKPAPPPPDPFLNAVRELGVLRADSARATPVAVSAVVRSYVVAAFGLPGSGMTTGEISSGLAAGSCPPDLRDAAGRFLGECDVAKFAPGAAGAGAGELVSRAEELLRALEASRATPSSAP